MPSFLIILEVYIEYYYDDQITADGIDGTCSENGEHGENKKCVHFCLKA
jgi:hypothetical protein